VYLKVIGSEKLLRLTTDPSTDSSPAWSPDGRQLAFVRFSRKQRAVLAIPALGGPERTLYTAEDRVAVPRHHPLAWTPDGKFIVLTESPADRKETRIILISSETSETRTLLSSSIDSVFSYSQPRFSPNGRQLAVVCWSSISNADIQLVTLASGQHEPLGLTKFNLRSFDFTADGREIIFATNSSLW
jgi:Tol biopolymer transport system component